jgi:O-methyltransferase involved in polyketide biosynthesis
VSTVQSPIDPNRPSAARIYDVLLGGTHNFATDRAVAARAAEIMPDVTLIARANRAFLQRAVRYATARGIDQFVDLGCGIPTDYNVHEIARETSPGSRVVYVDLDPTAVLYTRHLLGDDEWTVIVRGDLQEPDTILERPDVRGLLDFSRPVAVLMVAVLHFLPDGPALDEAVHAYRDATAPGSVLVVSHATAGRTPELSERVADLYNRSGAPLVLRDADRVARFFDGWDLVEPGLVFGPLWRPDGEPVTDAGRCLTLAGVGEK